MRVYKQETAEDLLLKLNRKLVEAQNNYQEHPCTQTRAELQYALRVFADLILRNKMPEKGP